MWRETSSDLPEALAGLMTAEGTDGRKDVIRPEIGEPYSIAGWNVPRISQMAWLPADLLPCFRQGGQEVTW